MACLQWVNCVSFLKTGRHKTPTPRAVLFRRLTIRLDWIPLPVKVFQLCHCYLSVGLRTTRTIPTIPAPLKFEEPVAEKENPSYIPTKENHEELLIKIILKSIRLLEEGTISTQDSVQDLKFENDALASKLAKSEWNVEKCRDEIMRLRTEAKDFRVELQTVASETAQLKTSTNVAVVIDFNTMRRDVPEFTQHVRVIATNLQALTGRVETVELHAVENVDSTFTELHKDQLEKFAFERYAPCGLFPKLEHDLSFISNKLESGGGIDWNGNYFFHDKKLPMVCGSQGYYLYYGGCCFHPACDWSDCCVYI
jgi:hypothetical protein